MQSSGSFNPVQGNWTAPWVYGMGKYLFSNQSEFLLTKVNYTKFQPAHSTLPKVVNEGCGNLQYEIVSRSYSEAWVGDEIMSRPPGNEYYQEFGTLHFISAKFRF